MSDSNAVPLQAFITLSGSEELIVVQFNVHEISEMRNHVRPDVGDRVILELLGSGIHLCIEETVLL